MSKIESDNRYTQEEQTEIVKDALILTRSIQIDNQQLKKLKQERFEVQPTAPSRMQVQIPKINPNIPKPPKAKLSLSDIFKGSLSKYKKLIIIIAIILAVYFFISSDFEIAIFLLEMFFVLPIIFVVFAVLYFIKKKDMNKELATSPEYLKEVEEAKRIAIEQQQQINKEYAEKQAKIDAEYETELEHYNNVLIPHYKKEFSDWSERQNKKAELLVEDIKLNSATLEALYNETKLISVSYRNLNLLYWLYNDMASSNHDIVYATELLDRDRQRAATLEAGSMAARAIGELESSIAMGLNDIYGAIEDGNYELAEMRKSQNRANVVSIIQRHNLNKMVKDYIK